MNKLNVVIDSVKAIQGALSYGCEIEAKLWEIQRIMKEDLHMRYRRIKSISNNGNSAKNLVLRQQFALKFIDRLCSGLNILNIDETWVAISDYRYMKWQPIGSPNSIPTLPVRPRITMIAGLDTQGNVYVSLT